ncbi:putative ribonuclease H-like domain-containing protein [Tanacetum coccineum]
MEQYLTFTDHALWKVIVNGDSVSQVASASAGAEGPIPPKTTKQKLARKNELKEKSPLMLAILDEHLLKFHACKDAKSLWEAIKNRFRGNEKSKKMQKNILKPNYENFVASSQEGLDKTYDRFQKLISQLEIHGEVISQEDTNLKLMRSLPSTWNNIRFNHEKTADLRLDTLSMGVAMLTMRVKRFIKKIGRKLDLNDKETVGFDRTKVECYNCHRRRHFAKECRAPRNQGNRNRDASRMNALVDTSTTNALVVQDGIGSSSSNLSNNTCSKDCLKSYEALQKQYDQQREALNKSNLEIIGYQMGLESLESRIVVHEKNEAFNKENIKILKYDVQVKDISIKDLKNQLEEALKEKDDLKKIEESLKNLTKLINSEGFHAVPPPYTGNYMPPRPDISFAGLDECVFSEKDHHYENVKSVNKENTHRQVEYPRKSQSPKGNRRNWNVMMTQKLGNGFEFIKKACFGNPQYTLQDQGIFDSGFSRHMTGNKSFLTDYQEIDGGFVAFRRSPKGGKFDGKADEGFLVGYSINSKDFRVFKTRTRKVEENLHITFIENKPNVARSGPDWLFDIDLLTNSMNYEPVTAGNQTNSLEDAVVDDDGKKTTEESANEGERNAQEKEGGASKKEGDRNVQDLIAKLDKLLVQQEEAYSNSTNRVSIVSPYVNAVGQSFINANDLPTNPLMPDLEDTTDLLNTGIFNGAYDDEDVGKHAIRTKWVYRNKKDERGIVVRNRQTGCTRLTLKEEGIYYDEENGFRRGTIDKTQFIKKDKGDILLMHVYVDDIIFGSTKKSLCVEFEQMMHKRFQMSSMGELTFFLGLQVKQKDDGIFINQDKYVADILKKFDFVTVKTASTLIETNKALLKDEAEDVDVHLYRSMIGSLIPSTPKVSQSSCNETELLDTRSEGQPKLGLWYPRDSPFNLEAFFDSDYTGSSLNRKSTTGGYQFLGKRLISWQCKKQTIVANSTTEASSSCQANVVDRDSYEKRLIQVIKIHTVHNVADLLIKEFDVSSISDEFGVKTGGCKVNAARQDLVLLGKKKSEGNADFHEIVYFLTASTVHYALTTVVISESSVRSDLHFNDEDGSTYLTNDAIFENLALIGYGRQYYACPSSKPEIQDRGCRYFMWKDDLRLRLSSSLGPQHSKSSS